jgi:hypothetical protein
MNTEHPQIDPSRRNPALRLPAALRVLDARMRSAMTERRASPPASERYSRADDEVAYLNELFVRLQRRMEIPDEIWLLGDDQTRSGRPPRPGRRAGSA